MLLPLEKRRSRPESTAQHDNIGFVLYFLAARANAVRCRWVVDARNSWPRIIDRVRGPALNSSQRHMAYSGFDQDLAPGMTTCPQETGDDPLAGKYGLPQYASSRSRCSCAISKTVGYDRAWVRIGVAKRLYGLVSRPGKDVWASEAMGHANVVVDIHVIVPVDVGIFTKRFKADLIRPAIANLHDGVIA